jgi:hypothetical protein
MAIYPKPGQALFYSTIDQQNEMPYKYTFAFHIPFDLHLHDATQDPTSIKPLIINTSLLWLDTL